MRGHLRYVLAAGVALAPLLAFRPDPALSQQCQCRTLYVAPAQVGTVNGSGTLTDPFVLTAGREYDFNKMIQPIVNAGVPLTVVFEDGVYQDVRLLIAKDSANTQSLYTDTDVNGTLVRNYRTGSTCTPTENCVLADADYTFGAGVTAPLYLTAMHRGKAIFDGTGTRDDPLYETSVPISVQGSLWHVNTAYPDVPYPTQVPKISGVTVDGFDFRNYRNGISVSFAYNIIVKNNIVENIGNRAPRTTDDVTFGVFALSIADDSRLTVFANNTIRNVYNFAGTFIGDKTSKHADAPADPGLIHWLYTGESRDTIFYNNTLDGVSGPGLKIAYYPDTLPDQTVYQYPSSPVGDRREFFIKNIATLRVMSDAYGVQPVYTPAQAFLHDNGTAQGTAEAPPASGQVVYDNQFINNLNVTSKVLLVRQEVNADDKVTNLPSWYFGGNQISNMVQGQLVGDRIRGTGTDDDSSIEFTQTDLNYASTWGLAAQNSPTAPMVANWLTPITALITGSGALVSDDTAEDAAAVALLQQIYTNGGI